MIETVTSVYNISKDYIVLEKETEFVVMDVYFKIIIMEIPKISVTQLRERDEDSCNCCQCQE
ncbi:hypothetical protein D3C80_1924510 [compost metagenome]